MFVNCFFQQFSSRSKTANAFQNFHNAKYPIIPIFFISMFPFKDMIVDSVFIRGYTGLRKHENLFRLLFETQIHIQIRIRYFMFLSIATFY